VAQWLEYTKRTQQVLGTNPWKVNGGDRTRAFDLNSLVSSGEASLLTREWAPRPRTENSIMECEQKQTTSDCLADGPVDKPRQSRPIARVSLKTVSCWATRWNATFLQRLFRRSCIILIPSIGAQRTHNAPSVPPSRHQSAARPESE